MHYKKAGVAFVLFIWLRFLFVFIAQLTTIMAIDRLPGFLNFIPVAVKPIYVLSKPAGQ